MTKYKIFESMSEAEFNEFQDECNDYLISSLQDQQNDECQFKTRIFKYNDNEFIVEIISIERKPIRKIRHFHFKDIKSDLTRYIEMSKYELKKVVGNGCKEDDRSVYQYKQGTRNWKSLSEIKDDQYMKSIELYLTK